jgi:hypothetical protein
MTSQTQSRVHSTSHVRAVPRRCPKCLSLRVHYSRRQGPFDQFLSSLGAEICRCHSCDMRQAWFVGPRLLHPWSGDFAVRLGKRSGALQGRWTGLLVLSTGFVLCLAVVWWAITRFTTLSG